MLSVSRVEENSAFALVLGTGDNGTGSRFVGVGMFQLVWAVRRLGHRKIRGRDLTRSERSAVM